MSTFFSDDLTCQNKESVEKIRSQSFDSCIGRRKQPLIVKLFQQAAYVIHGNEN